MEAIVNYELIKEKIDDFSWRFVSFISDFHYRKARNKYYEEKFILDIEFVVKTLEGKLYLMKVQFREISDLEFFASGTYIQHSGFSIIDIKEDGWSELRFKIYDYEQNDFKFFCNEIEIMTLEETAEIIGF
jgi:hypothetical protein